MDPSYVRNYFAPPTWARSGRALVWPKADRLPSASEAQKEPLGPTAGVRPSEGISLHLAEIAQAVTPGAHAVVLLDQAGWHLSKRLKIPANITLVPLPVMLLGITSRLD